MTLFLTCVYYFFNRAADDIPNAETIRTILKDLRETRQAKSRMGVKILDDTWLGVSLYIV